MVSAPPKPRPKRLTRAEALELARQQQAQPKPKRKVDVAEEDSAARDRDRWVTLPPHLAAYIGEEAVISQGIIWTHRKDKEPYEVTADGIKKYKVRPVCLGKSELLDKATFEREKSGAGQPDTTVDKTGDFVLSQNATRSSDQSPPKAEVLSHQGGRPRASDEWDERILALAGEGHGARAIARVINRDANDAVMSYRTVARRLKEMEA